MTVATSDAVQRIAVAFDRLSRRRLVYTWLGVGIVVLSLAGGFTVAEDANSGSFFDGIPHIFDFPIDILAESVSAGWGWFGLLGLYFPYLIETINIAVVSTIIGFAGGTGLSLLASRNLIDQAAARCLVRRGLDVMRALPELVVALFMIVLLGGGPVPAVIAVSLHTIGALGKLFSEVNENVDMRPVVGLRAVGGTWSQQIRYGVVPQVLPNYLSYGLLRFEINVRASAILGFVGAGGLGQQLKSQIDWRHGDDVSAIIALLILTIIAIDQLSSHLRRRLVRRENRI